MVETNGGDSGIKRGRRGKKKRGGSKGRLADDGGSNDGPRQQQQQQQQRFPVVADPRFASMHNAPNFRRSKPDDRKVLLDDRFKAVLTDPRFQVSGAKVDKYGRKVKKASRTAEKQLRTFYKVDNEDDVKDNDDKEDNIENDDEEKERPIHRGDEAPDDDEAEEEGDDEEVDNDEEEEVDDDEEDNEKEEEEEEGDDDEEEIGLRKEGRGGRGKGVMNEKVASPVGLEAESRQAYLTKLSRGEISVSSSSDSSDSSSENGEDGGGMAGDSDPDDSDADGDGQAGAAESDGPSLGGGRARRGAPVSKESSRRLAVTNCDWDHLRARDLMVLCDSFCPSNARLSSVTVYPSDFGLEMLELENTAGPHAVLAGSKLPPTDGGAAEASDSSHSSGEDGSENGQGQGEPLLEEMEEGNEEESDAEAESKVTTTTTSASRGVSTAAGVAVGGKVVRRRRPGVIIEDYRGTEYSAEEEKGDDTGPGMSRELAESEGVKAKEGKGKGLGEEFDPEKLRAYELRKLKYYFAVMEFNTAVAAEAVYKEVDGMEFEHSAVALDLRFVPEGVSFEGRKVRESCSSVPSSYQPPAFICKALQQTRVECTWDEVPAERQILLGRMSQWRDAAEEDFEAYLGSSSEESDDEDDYDDYGVSDRGREERGGGGDIGDGEAGNGGVDAKTGDDESKAGETSKKAKGKQRRKLSAAAASRRARKLLLQDALGSDAEGDSAEEEEEEEEKERCTEPSEAYSAGERESGGRHEDEEREDGNREFTFVPRGTGSDEEGMGGIEGLLARKKQRDVLADETPWEASLRRERERKRARKKALKERLQEGEEEGVSAGPDDDFFLEEASVKRGAAPGEQGGETDGGPDNGSGAWNSLASSKTPEREDEEEEERRDYDMHRLVREEKMKGKKLRGKRKRKEMAREKAPGQDFTVDVKDERFAAALEGDTRFGIDRTDSSFKDTEGMRHILEERARRRDKRYGTQSGAFSVLRGGTPPANGHDGTTGGVLGARGGMKDKGDLSSLVSKLKSRGLGVGGHSQQARVEGDTSDSRKGRRGKKKRRG